MCHGADRLLHKALGEKGKKESFIGNKDETGCSVASRVVFARSVHSERIRF